jgi:hypothetical protein
VNADFFLPLDVIACSCVFSVIWWVSTSLAYNFNVNCYKFTSTTKEQHNLKPLWKRNVNVVLHQNITKYHNFSRSLKGFLVDGRTQNQDTKILIHITTRNSTAYKFEMFSLCHFTTIFVLGTCFTSALAP